MEQEKQKMFNDNIPLAKFFVRKNYGKYAKFFEEEDLYQHCLIGLWQACQNYNPKYVFSNFAYACMRNELSNEIQKHYTAKKSIPDANGLQSIDATYDDGEPIYNPSVEYDFTRNLSKIEIRKKLKLLTSKQLDAVYRFHYLDETMKDIAKDLGKSRESVRQLLSSSYKRLRKPLEVYAK